MSNLSGLTLKFKETKIFYVLIIVGEVLASENQSVIF